MATIDDVAKAVGVSKGTVSSVFSKKRPISQEVTERVLAVAKELGYYPNHVARSLATRKTMIAGLKMPISRDMSLSGFEIQMINGVMKQLAKHGYRVLLDTLPEHDDPTSFSMDPVDGVILLNPRKADPRIDRYGQMGIPIVLVGRPDPDDRSLSYVDNDNEALACEVGRYLLGLGHRSVLFLNTIRDMTVASDRAAGLRRAFAERGLALDDDRIAYYSHEAYGNAAAYGYSALREMWGRQSFTAVITDTDRVALGVYRAARELGIAIPDELSVIALNNDATLAQEMEPQLTAVELYAETLGIEAASLLMNMMAEYEPQQKMIETKLIVRSSCKSLV